MKRTSQVVWLQFLVSNSHPIDTLRLWYRGGVHAYLSLYKKSGSSLDVLSHAGMCSVGQSVHLDPYSMRLEIPPLSGRDWLHFAPAFMYIMYSLIIFIGDKIIIGDYYFYADQRDKDLDPWYQVAGFFSLLLLRRETNWDSFYLTMPNGEYKNVETNVSLSIRNISGLEYEVDINGANRQGLLITRERMLVDNYQIEFGTTEGTSITSLKLNGERIKNVSFIKKK